MDIEILGKPFDEYMVRTHYGCELKIKRITS
jgi:hypothetical protein